MIRHSRLTAMGMMLCLLAALFAIEAKIGWYSPAGSADAQISYAKARPAEPSKALPQRVTSPAPPALDSAGTATLLAAALLLSLTTALVIRLAPAHHHASASPAFRTALFDRPPPVL